jgi:hypothetical protein
MLRACCPTRRFQACIFLDENECGGIALLIKRSRGELERVTIAPREVRGFLHFFVHRYLTCGCHFHQVFRERCTAGSAPPCLLSFCSIKVLKSGQTASENGQVSRGPNHLVRRRGLLCFEQRCQVREGGFLAGKYSMELPLPCHAICSPAFVS